MPPEVSVKHERQEMPAGHCVVEFEGWSSGEQSTLEMYLWSLGT